MSDKRKVYRTEVVLADRDGGAIGRRTFDALFMRCSDGFLEFAGHDRTVRAFNVAHVIEYTMKRTGETVIIEDEEADE